MIYFSHFLVRYKVIRLVELVNGVIGHDHDLPLDSKQF